MLFQRAWQTKLDGALQALRDKADLPIRLILTDASVHDLGQFAKPEVTISIRDDQALKALAVPDLGSLGDAYVRGWIDIDGKLENVIRQGYALVKSANEAASLVQRAAAFYRHSRTDDRAAIKHHYDVSNDFYTLWLDQRMVYSCAYFDRGDEDLDTAQLAKLDHVLTKIRVQPGDRLLDIGCGWGALAMRAAEKYGARCLGITLSDNQFELARERVRAAGLEERVEIRLQDYRDLDPRTDGQFERITSVGMFEHVGRKNLSDYFRKIRSLLTDNGVVMNHGITSIDPESGGTSLGGADFINRYVFPQGELPHLSLVVEAMQHGGLEAWDIENLRRHYARTCALWAQRFEAQVETIRAHVDEQRFRIWRIYLAGCAHAFATDQVSIHQVVCTPSEQHADALPWSRRYIYKQ